MNSAHEAGTDVEHLDAAMLWLRDAQAAVPGGVAARYDLARGWQPAYPETSGYIIGTLLHHADATGQPGAVARARAIGDWLLGIQDPTGFVAGGLVGDDGAAGSRPSVFNTGQVVFGLVALAQHTGDERYADGARRACTWLLGEQDPSGAWIRSSLHGVPRAYCTCASRGPSPAPRSSSTNPPSRRPPGARSPGSGAARTTTVGSTT